MLPRERAKGKVGEREHGRDFSPKSKGGTLARRAVELNAVSVAIRDTPRAQRRAKKARMRSVRELLKEGRGRGQNVSARVRNREREREYERMRGRGGGRQRLD